MWVFNVQTFKMWSSLMLVLALSLVLLLFRSCLADIAHDSETIDTVLARVAGVYHTEPGAKPRHPGLEKTVVLTGCNHGFLNHLQNFKCFMDRLGMKFLVVALDRKTHDYLRLNTTMESIYMNTASSAGISEESASFRSAQFNLITARKKEAVHDVLTLGYDVLFSDTDVALVRDPFKYLLWENVDYVHSLNQICDTVDHWSFRGSPKEEGNTGFYYVKSNQRTIKLWQTAYEAVPHYPGLDDQAVFWRIIRQSTDPPVVPIGTCKHYTDQEAALLDPTPANALVPLVTCVLDPCVFSSGMLSRVWVPEYTYEQLLENVALRNESICAVHANYLSGNAPKMQRMQEYGFWLATKSGTKGAASHDHINGTAGHGMGMGGGGGKHSHEHHEHHHETNNWGGECLEYVFHNESEFAKHKRRRLQLLNL